jgi:hypothetical protein
VPLALVALAYVLALVQRPGTLVADTKVDLYVDARSFLTEVLSAWSPTADLGHVWAGQYGGYAWPMASWFAAGDALGLPAWLVHRLWLGTLLAVAAVGMVRLLDALVDAGRGPLHVAAAVLYVANPYVTVYLGRTSVALLAHAALPWLLLLVHRGLHRPRSWRAPAAFALVLASTGGGVNAATTAWALLAPALLVLYELGWGGVRARALVPWAGRMALTGLVAQAWWVVPLLVAARHGTGFLAFTEQPGTIWGTTALTESLRLMGFWTSYIGVGYGGRLVPFSGSSDALLFHGAVVAASLLVPALAATSFAWTRRARYAPFFLVLVLVGAAVMTAGFPEGTPLRRALTFTYNRVEAVQVLRTSYKAGPLVALGVAALGGLALQAAWARLPSRAGRGLLVAGAAGLAAAASWPLVSGRAPERQLTFVVPPAYEQAARALDARGTDTRVLQLPGQLFAYAEWGGTIDPLLPVLMERPVAARALTPYADLRAVELQWAVDDLVTQERVLPGQLPDLLDLLGVGDVVLAADGDVARAGQLAPAEAARALRGQGLAFDRAFGPVRPRPAAADRLAGPVRLPQLAAARTRTGGLLRVLPRGPLTVVDGRRRGPDGSGGLRGAGPAAPARLRPGPQHGGDQAGGRGRGRPRRGRRQPPAGLRVLAPAGQPRARPARRPGRLRGRHDARPVREAGSRDADRGAPGGRAPSRRRCRRRSRRSRSTGPFARWTAIPTRLARRPLLARERHALTVTFPAARDVPWIELLPFSNAFGRVRAVEVEGRRFAVGPGFSRLELGLRGVASSRWPWRGSRARGGARRGRAASASCGSPGWPCASGCGRPWSSSGRCGAPTQGGALTYLFAAADRGRAAAGGAPGRRRAGRRPPRRPGRRGPHRAADRPAGRPDVAGRGVGARGSRCPGCRPGPARRRARPAAGGELLALRRAPGPPRLRGVRRRLAGLDRPVDPRAARLARLRARAGADRPRAAPGARRGPRAPPGPGPPRRRRRARARGGGGARRAGAPAAAGPRAGVPAARGGRRLPDRHAAAGAAAASGRDRRAAGPGRATAAGAAGGAAAGAVRARWPRGCCGRAGARSPRGCRWRSAARSRTSTRAGSSAPRRAAGRRACPPVPWTSSRWAGRCEPTTCAWSPVAGRPRCRR